MEAMRAHRLSLSLSLSLSLQNPPKTSLEYFTNLKSQGLAESVKTIGQDPSNFI